jgi:hypothetical protein
MDPPVYAKGFAGLASIHFFYEKILRANGGGDHFFVLGPFVFRGFL